MNGSLTFLLNLCCPLLSFLSFSNAARILGVFPMTGKSHFSCNDAIMKSLHAAGHHITFISPFPSEKQVENFTMIDSRFNDTFVFLSKTPIFHFADMSVRTLSHETTLTDEKLCYDVMKLKEIQDALSSAEKPYDVMFIELLFMYPCYLPIARKLGIPVIGTITMRTWNVGDNAIGLPNNPATIPHPTSDSDPPRMTFVERLKAVWDHLIMDYFAYHVVPIKINKFYQKYFPDFKLQDKNISLVFYNSHASVLSRPTIPNVIEVGGILVQPAKPLPHNFQIFIDEAEAGVILFTFGSVIRASSLPAAARTAFVNAFAAIPQRVIWKFEEPIEGISDNVLLSNWVPQRDILDHKNVKAFISHCGVSGMYEAIHTGTPVITTPLFGDQPSNAVALEVLGVGVHLDIKTVTTDKVLEALNTIINDTRYYDKMQSVSRVFKDRPMTPQESIVFWTEYVIRHNGAPHLQAVGSQLLLYQYFLIDVLCLVIVLVILVSCTTVYLSKKLYRIVKHSKYLIRIEKEKKMR